MAEVLDVLASITEVASLGHRLLLMPTDLYDYMASAVHTKKRRNKPPVDIVLALRALATLAWFLKDNFVQDSVLEKCLDLARDAVAECDATFEAMESMIANIGKKGVDNWDIYVQESNIELLGSNLGRVNGNLQLLMEVITYHAQYSRACTDEIRVNMKLNDIRRLMIEKEVSTQNYLEKKRKYDDLLVTTNSTDSLGSTSTVFTIHLETEPSSVHAVKADDTTQTCLHLDLHGSSRKLGDPGASKNPRPKICGFEEQRYSLKPSTIASPTANIHPSTTTMNSSHLGLQTSSERAPSTQHQPSAIPLTSSPQVTQPKFRLGPRPWWSIPPQSPLQVPSASVARKRRRPIGPARKLIAQGNWLGALFSIAISLPSMLLSKINRNDWDSCLRPPMTSYDYHGHRQRLRFPVQAHDYCSKHLGGELPAIGELSPTAPELDLIASITPAVGLVGE